MRKTCPVLILVLLLFLIPLTAYAWQPEGVAKWNELPKSIQTQLSGEDDFLYCYVNGGVYSILTQLDEHYRVVHVFRLSSEQAERYDLEVRSAPLPMIDGFPAALGSNSPVFLWIIYDEGGQYFGFGKQHNGKWKLQSVQARSQFIIDPVFGLEYADNGTGDEHCLPGVLPDYNLATVDATIFPRSIDDAITDMDISSYAMVVGDASTSQSSLLSEPHMDAALLGMYYSGTPVNVLAIDGSWAEVDICGAKGYLQAEFLTFGLSMLDVPRHFPYMALLSEYEEQGVFVYSQPEADAPYYLDTISNIHSNLNTKFLGRVGDEWFHIARSDGLTGYVQAQYFYNEMSK